ncbi:MAG: hypothetical protein GX085_10120 [Firmicutes bacterium]|nr:hypothetical protein [Bacillota bacterium]
MAGCGAWSWRRTGFAAGKSAAGKPETQNKEKRPRGKEKKGPPGRADLIVLLILVVALFSLSISRFFSLNSGAFLRGADAYYYALQARSLVEKGEMYIPDSSPFIPLLALTSQTGLTYEEAINLWIAIIQLLAALNLLLVWGLARRGGKGGAWVLPLFLGWAILSPAFFFTALEFPRYALGLALLPLWPVAFVNRRFWFISIGAIVLSCMLHRAAIGLLGLAFAGAGFFFIFKRRVWRNLAGMATDPERKRIIATAGVGAGVFLAVFFLFVLTKTGHFSWLDLARFDWQKLQPAWLTFFQREAIPLVLKVEVFLSLLITGGTLTYIVYNAVAKRKLLTLASWLWLPFFFSIILFPLGSTEIMGVAERFCLAVPWVTVIFLFPFFLDARGEESRLVRSSREKVMRSRRKVISSRGKKMAASLLTSGVLLLILLALIFPKDYLELVHPGHLDPDYQLYEEVTRILEEHEIPMLIAHRGLNFYYKYRTLREAFHYEPEDHWPKELIWRVVYGITPSEWVFYLPPYFLWDSGKLHTLVGPYSLVREDGWVEFREAVRQSGDEYLQERVFSLWLNPAQKRPAFLYQKHSADEGVFSARPKN